MRSILTAIVAALVAAPVVSGHSWIEQLRNIDDQGKYVGQYGYPRGMVSKTDPGYNGFSMNFQLPNAQDGALFINESTPLCHPNQTTQQQSQDKYPRLQAVPGGFMAMRYTENGHITLPNNQKGKPVKGGTIFVYGTTEPKEDEKLADVLQWTKDGQGGDKRGTIIAMNDFDDSRCYELNQTPLSADRRKATPNFAIGQVVNGTQGNYPLMCENDVQLPKSAVVGKPYTMYWVWQWNTAPGGVDPGLPKGKDEYYTTCIDVDVASADVAMAAAADPKFDIGPQQDAMTVAVSDWASRTAVMTDVIKGEVGPIFSSNPTGAPSASGAAPSPSSGASPASGASSATGSGSSLDSTAPPPTQIPTLTGRPDTAPTSVSGDAIEITVTDTVYITVTAPAASQSPSPAVAPRAAHNIRYKNGARFRGMFAA